MKHILKKIYLYLTISCWLCAGQDNYLKVGNLALTTSQQPSPLFSFGQNIVDKGDLQLFFFGEYLKSSASNFSEVIPSILWGVTDHLSLFFSIPFLAEFPKKAKNSINFQDVSVQLEYAYYTSVHENYTAQATIVAFIGVPTHVSQSIPDTGLGNPGFFIGTTFSNIGTKWYFYVSPGFVFSTKKNGSKAGNQILYQFGLGRNIVSSPRSITTILWEFNGVYSQKNLYCNQINHLSGGNIFYTGPSLFFSTQKLTVLAGIAVPIAQDFNDRSVVNYLIGLDIGWKF